MTSPNRQLAEAFARHDFATVYPALRDATRWELVGERVLAGRREIETACEQLRAYLTTVTTRFEQVDVTEDGNRVEVVSLAAYVDADGATSRVSARDVFTFAADGTVATITSANEEV